MLNDEKEKEVTTAYIEQLRIKTPNQDQVVNFF